jgi:lysophospholipase L1-like esterase
MSKKRGELASSNGRGWPKQAWFALVGVGLLGVVAGGLVIRQVWPEKEIVIVVRRAADLLAEGVYIALGDSYSAGEGLPPFQPGTENAPQGDRCHRSVSDGYPLFIWWGGMTERRFRACAGADVRNIYDEVQKHGGVPSMLGLQLEPDIMSDDVKLITITIGGNDVGFAKVLKFCALLFPPTDGCLNNEFDPYDDFQPDPTLETWINARFTQLGDDLDTLYGRLRAAAPSDVRILVLGYPSLFPEEIQFSCFGELGLFNKTERRGYIRYGVTLNNLIRERALAANLEYIDTMSLFSTHEPCGAGGSDWMRFPSINSIDGWFHPNETGQEKLARAVLCYLDAHRGGVNAAPEATVTIDPATKECFESSDIFPAPPTQAEEPTP